MVATIVLDGTKIANGDDVGVETWDATRWRGSGGAPSAAQSGDVFIENTDAVITRSTNSRVWLWFDIGASNELDFTPSTGANDGEHVSIWMVMLASGLLQVSTYVNGTERGGLGIAIGSSTTNYDYWNFGGKDTYAGGWINLTIDPTKTPSGDGGTGLDISSARYFGCWVDTSVTAKFDNFVVDSIVSGFGLRVYGTSTTDDLFGDILDADEGTVANKYGTMRSDNGIIYVKGQLLLGDDVGTNASTLTSANRTVVYEMQEYYTSGSAWVSSVSSTFHALKRVGNSTNGTALTLGGGTAIQAGVSKASALVPVVTIDLDDVHTGSGADLTIDGARFAGISGGLDLSVNGAHTCDNSIFDDCIQVTGAGDASDGIVIRDCTFQNYSGEDGALLWGDGGNNDAGMDLSNCVFNNNNGGTNSAGIEYTSNDTTHTLTNVVGTGNDYDVHNSSSTNKTISLTGTSNFSTKRENPGTVTYSNDKTLSVTGLVAGENIAVYRADGAGSTDVDKSQFTSHASSNTSGNSTFVITTTIPSDTPSSGTLKVYQRDTDGKIIREDGYTYTSWSSSTFSGVSPTLARTYDSNDTAIVPYIEKVVTTTPESVSLNYSVDRNLVVVWRLVGYKSFRINGIFGSSGFSTGVVKTRDPTVNLP